MKQSLIAILLLILAIPEWSLAQDSKVDSLSNYRVEDAPEWTNMFLRTNGWFGADGVFSFSLDGKENYGAGNNRKNLLTFSDTMTGEVVDDTVYNFKMVNNSVAFIDGVEPSETTMDILLRESQQGVPGNFFSPETPNTQPDEYYWMGDGFINNEDGGSLNIFGYRVRDNSEKSWDFEVTGVTIITVPGDDLEPPFESHTQIDAPVYIDHPIHGKGTFGSGVYVNTEWAGAPSPDGFVYVYGLVDPDKKMVVARVLPSTFKDFDNWEFWDGTGWNSDINSIQPVVERISNEVSLSPLPDGRYLLTFQLDGIGNHTVIRVAETPVGPFGPIQKIRKVPELSEPPGIIPYNAKAHPILSSENRILISYNTITLDYFNDILNYPHSYRPRFFWLILED